VAKRVVGVLISPGAAVAQTARGTNPYQVRYKNGHCIFSLDETNPEARKYLALIQIAHTPL